MRYDPKSKSNDSILSKKRKKEINELQQDPTYELYASALQQKENLRDNYVNNYLTQNKLARNEKNIDLADNAFEQVYKTDYNDLYRELQGYQKQWQQDHPQRSLADIGVGILASGADLATDIGEGFLRSVEGVTDWASYRIGDISDFIGLKDFANKARGFADFDATGTYFGKNQNVQQNIFGNWTKGIEENSVFNDTFDQIFQGVGNVGALAGTAYLTGGSTLGTIFGSYTSAYGNARSEAKRNGASDRDANRAGIINGFAEAISEQFFDALPGMKVEGWGNKATGWLSDKTAKYFGTGAGKATLKVMDSLGEGAEEIISNSIQAVATDLMHNLDKNYTYGMENLTGDAWQDFLNQWTSQESWDAFFSAAMTSALINGGKAVIDTRTQNQIINAYAKDNNMSFQDAKYILTGQQEVAQAEIERDVQAKEQEEYNSKAELEEQAKNRVLNYMQTYTGQNIETEINNRVNEIIKEQNLELTEEEKKDLTKQIRASYEDSLNSANRYRTFEMDDSKMSDKDKSLYKSFQESKINNTKEAHNLYEIMKTLQDNNKTSNYQMVTNESLQKMEGLQKIDGTINGFKKGDTIYINKDAANPYQTVIGHEIGEAIKSSDPDSYKGLRDLVMQVYGEGNLDEYRKAYRVKDGEVSSNLTDDIVDEYVNDKLGEMLESEKLVNRIANNENLLQRLIREVKRIAKYITSNSEKKQIMKLEKTLEDKYIELYKKADFTVGSEQAQYSISQDSQGRELSQQQQEYFKDSKVRDSEGKLLEVYHGSLKAGFTQFNRNYNFYTNNENVAQTYSGSKEVVDTKKLESINDAKSWLKGINKELYIENNSVYDYDGEELLKYDNSNELLKNLKRDIQNEIGNTEAGGNYKGYINITNPLIVNVNGGKWSAIDINGIELDNPKEFLEKYGSSTFRENGAIRTSTNDIVAAIEEAIDNGEVNYDGIIFKDIKDEGGYSNNQKNAIVADDYVTFNSNQFKAADNTNPTQDADIRYSLSQEQNKNTQYGNINQIQTYQDYMDSFNLPQQIEESNLPEDTKEQLIEEQKTSMEEKRKQLADKRFAKMIEKQTYKSLNAATKTAKSYLDFNQKQTQEFKDKLTKLAKMPKDNLIKAKNYEQVRDVIKQYANKDYTFIDKDIKQAQKDIRNTELIVSDDLKDQITDWSDFRKSSGLNIRKGAKSNVDTFYEEMSSMYPEYLDRSITNYADQLQELSDFVKRDAHYTEHYELNDDSINNITNKVWEKLSNNALTKQEIDDLQTEITKKAEARTREVVREDLLEQMDLNENDIQAGNDVGNIAFQRTDPRRLNEKVFGREVGQKINDATVEFVRHQEAERTRFLNNERQQIEDLGIKPRSKESAAVQKWGEGQYVNSKGELVEYNDNNLMSEFKDQATIEKIKNAAEFIRNKYDTYLDRINQSLEEMGYDPIPKRKDYFMHFAELEDKLSKWGIPYSPENMSAEDLSTDINGLTDQFKPGKNFFAQAMQRKGVKTTYDAITGIDRYLEGASNLMYHTESIQRYRALSKLIRDTYGQTHGLDDIDSMSDEQKAQRLEDVYNNKLTKYAAWLDEQANALAGKKGGIDRAAERLLGRKVYTGLNAIKSQVGSNMTGFNVRSAMTNFASAVQGASKTNKWAFLKGTMSTLRNIIHDDGLINKSDFLTTRFGSDMLSKKAWQKASAAGQIFMSGTDYFTANQIWRGKYYEGLQNGLTEDAAIKNADDFASRIMGDRSKGQTAEIFNSKTLGLLTQFQLEVNNQWSSMIHDNKMALQEGNGAKVAASVTFQLGQLYAMSWMFNNMMKALTGSDVMFDPIDLLMKLFDPDDDKTIEEKAQSLLGDVVNQLPMASVFTGGRIPISEAFQGVDTGFKYLTGQKDKYGNAYTLEDVGNDLIGSAAYYLFPTGYGQLKKTTQGLMMYDENLPIAGSYTNSGRLRFEADTSTGGKIQAALFGRNASANAREYYDKGYNTLTEKQINEVVDLNIPVSEYRKIDEGLKKAKQEAKESGANQTEAEYNYIYNLPLNNTQKNTLLNSKLGTSDNVTDENGYVKYTDGSKTYWYDSKTDTVYNSKYRKMDNIDVSDLTKYSNKKDIEDYGKYGSLAEFNYANGNPEKYTAITQITSYDNYTKYKDDIAAIKDNYNDGTTEGKNKAKEAVYNYINKLQLNQQQKTMLFKMAGGYSIKGNEDIMYNYINSLDLTKAEKENIYKELFG